MSQIAKYICFKFQNIFVFYCKCICLELFYSVYDPIAYQTMSERMQNYAQYKILHATELSKVKNYAQFPIMHSSKYEKCKNMQIAKSCKFGDWKSFAIGKVLHLP